MEEEELESEQDGAVFPIEERILILDDVLLIFIPIGMEENNLVDGRGITKQMPILICFT